MFSCTSTNTSMSAKRRTRLFARGTFRMEEMASASGRLLLPATSLMRGAARLRLASRGSKGIDGTPFTTARVLARRRAYCKLGPAKDAFSRGLSDRFSSTASAADHAQARRRSVDGLGRWQQLDD